MLTYLLTLTYFLPEIDTLQANPVFALERRHLLWPRTDDEITKYNRIILVSSLVVAAAGWIIVARFRNNSADLAYFWELVIFLSAAFMLFCSFYTGVMTTSSIQQRIDSGQWDDLRITLQSGSTVVEAYDALAQIRAWRLTLIEIALRLCGSTIFVIDWLYFSLSSSDQHLLLDPLCWIWTTTIVFILGAFILEPVYRMRVIVALSIFITLNIQNVVYDLLADFAVILLILVLQLAALAGTFYIVQWIADSGEAGVVGLACVLPVMLITIISLLYFLYGLVRQKTLSRAFHNAHN
jgi:hypothetical protein